MQNAHEVRVHVNIIYNKNYFHAACEPCSGFVLEDLLTFFNHSVLIKQAGPAVLDRLIRNTTKKYTQLVTYMTMLKYKVQIQNIRK